VFPTMWRLALPIMLSLVFGTAVTWRSTGIFGQA
jgi:hypothetical protein